MIPERDLTYLTGLVHNLRQLPREPEWVEFKVNSATNAETIGEYVSALANAAALNGKDAAYILWGIEDGSNAVVGTQFRPAMAKQGNEPLESWLRRGLTPRVDFRFHEVAIDRKRVVVLEIEPATQQPVACWGKERIRIGDVTTELRNHPEKERALWQLSTRVSFENGIALERASDEDVLSGLNYPSYFDMLGRPLPDGRAAILSSLQDRQLIVPCDAGGWNITNVAVILLARNLYDFPLVWSKTMR